ncbi:hypothetical protein [Salinirubrum litoreum]|nr:hypothetical protein [Salinirubrum litoreum]
MKHVAPVDAVIQMTATTHPTTLVLHGRPSVEVVVRDATARRPARRPIRG